MCYVRYVNLHPHSVRLSTGLRLLHPNDLQNYLPGSRIRGRVEWQG